MEKDNYQLARRRVKKRKGFYAHLAVYIIVNTFIFAVNFLENPWSWEIGPALPWGIGLAFHYLGVFGFPGSGILSKEWEEAEIQKEMKRLEDAEPLEPHRSTQNPKEEQMELKELKKQWKDTDLV